MMKPPHFYFIVRALPCQGKEKEACKMVTIVADLESCAGMQPEIMPGDTNTKEIKNFVDLQQQLAVNG